MTDRSGPATGRPWRTIRRDLWMFWWRQIGAAHRALPSWARRGRGAGRRIVQDELQRGGSALPWLDPIGFARGALATAITDYGSQAVGVWQGGWAFFDRGIIDAAAAIAHLTGEPALATMEQAYRYHRRVFLTPPWPELYATDEERRHDFEAALGEYARLLEVYPSLGYEVYILPKVGISERADDVLRVLSGHDSETSNQKQTWLREPGA